MKENREAALNYILEDEGGYTTKHGLGGATNHGISFTFYKEVCAKEGKPTPTKQDLKNLTYNQAKDIYENHVLPKVRFDDLPTGLDYVMANAAVMEGSTGAIKLLEQEIGQTITGHVDNILILSIADIASSIRIAAGVIIRQMDKKMHDKRVGTYGPGWANRLIKVWDRTLKL